jgi:hypothetical protein
VISKSYGCGGSTQDFVGEHEGTGEGEVAEEVDEVHGVGVVGVELFDDTESGLGRKGRREGSVLVSEEVLETSVDSMGQSLDDLEDETQNVLGVDVEGVSPDDFLERQIVVEPCLFGLVSQENGVRVFSQNVLLEERLEQRDDLEETRVGVEEREEQGSRRVAV